jgi:hypothetical protein
MNTLPDWLRRAIRTFAQAFLGVMITQWGTLALKPGEIPDESVLRSLVIAGIVAGIVAVVTATHNALEDHAGLPALLKSPPSPGQQPVPSPHPDEPTVEYHP